MGCVQAQAEVGVVLCGDDGQLKLGFMGIKKGDHGGAKTYTFLDQLPGVFPGYNSGAERPRLVGDLDWWLLSSPQLGKPSQVLGDLGVLKVGGKVVVGSNLTRSAEVQSKKTWDCQRAHLDLLHPELGTERQPFLGLCSRPLFTPCTLCPAFELVEWLQHQDGDAITLGQLDHLGSVRI